MTAATGAIELYDTTLRDGTQGEHINLSVQDKLLIAQKLDEFGMDYIEGGWPSSNPKDEEFFIEARKLKLKHAKAHLFRLNRPFCGKRRKRPKPARSASLRNSGYHHLRKDMESPLYEEPGHLR